MCLMYVRYVAWLLLTVFETDSTCGFASGKIWDKVFKMSWINEPTDILFLALETLEKITEWIVSVQIVCDLWKQMYRLWIRNFSY